MSKKSLAACISTPPDAHLTNQPSLQPVGSTFSPHVGSFLLAEKSSFVPAHNVSIDDDQAGAHRTSYVHKCQMQTHL